MIDTSKHAQYFHIGPDIYRIYYTFIRFEIEGMNEFVFHQDSQRISRSLLRICLGKYTNV